MVVFKAFVKFTERSNGIGIERRRTRVNQAVRGWKTTSSKLWQRRILNGAYGALGGRLISLWSASCPLPARSLQMGLSQRSVRRFLPPARPITTFSVDVFNGFLARDMLDVNCNNISMRTSGYFLLFGLFRLISRILFD